ncbi:sugar phosphate nucleotidyltransferase, partial [Streptomyces caeruleatus]
QAEPKGIAEAFIIAEKFINNGPCCLVLGDNILYGAGNIRVLQEKAKVTDGASIFCLSVTDPQRYGIVTFDQNNKAVKIE